LTPAPARHAGPAQARELDLPSPPAAPDDTIAAAGATASVATGTRTAGTVEPQAPVGGAPGSVAVSPAPTDKPRQTSREANPAPQAAKIPRFAVYTLGVPTRRAFWNREEEAGYSARMAALFRDKLLEQSREKIHVATGPHGKVVEYLFAGMPQAQKQACESTGAGVLFAAMAREGFSISAAESAFWPELRLVAIVCDGGDRRERGVNLAPGREEAFPFAEDMAKAMTGFLRDNPHLLR
jgi:hypothetical protein